MSRLLGNSPSPTQAPQSEVGDDKRNNSDSVETIQVAKVENIPHIPPPLFRGGGWGLQLTSALIQLAVAVVCSPKSDRDDYPHPENTSVKNDSFRAYVIWLPWSVL